RSFARVLAVDVGFDPSSVITMEVAPVDPDPEVARQYYPALVEALRHRPGVEAVGAVDHVPLTGSSTGTLGRVGDRAMPLNTRHFVPGYFEAIGFALTAGRFPTEADASTELPSAVINAS